MLIFNWDVCKMQHGLNDLGADLVPDGLGGIKTRTAVIETFRNTSAKSIGYTDKLAIASRLGGTTKQVNAVAKVESNGGGWDNTGLLKCLYERHHAWKRFRIQNSLLSNPKPGGYTTDIDNDGINDNWEKVADAACKWGETAFEFASWGKFQIMGAWWNKLGYASVLDFIYQLSRSEADHYDAMARYVEKFNLAPAFRRLSMNPKDCVPFAKGYNGPKYYINAYDVKLAQAMEI